MTYEILQQEAGLKKQEVVLPYRFQSKKSLSQIGMQYGIGLQTLEDIIAELANPGLDPREAFDEAGFRSGVLTLEDLDVGMHLTGVIRNIVDFGAFVDIGLKNDGLIHKSQLGRRVSSVFEVLSL